MASRMDRYYKTELVSGDRSSKNKRLYERIQDLDSYSNIEGVADIENSNEIDIEKVRAMLASREQYNKMKKYTREEETEDIVSTNVETLDDIKSYDINSILDKVRENNSKEKYRSLDKKQYDDLKNIKKRSQKNNIYQEEDELKELIKTLHAAKALVPEENDVGLLDDLKSDTMVGDAASIKSIIEEEKKNTSEEVNESLDDSFYTKSFGFTSSDFEELKDINHKIKKGNKFIIILLVVLILLVAIIAGIIFLPKILY